MKYQIIISADTPAELVTIVAKLEDRVGVSGDTSAIATPPVEPYVRPELQGVAQAVVAPAGPSVAATVLAEPNPFAPPVAAVVPTPNVVPVPVVTAAPSVITAPAPTAVSTTPVGAVELDPRGFPWDSRIHSDARTRLKKGNFWKYARNTPQELIDQVEAELRAEGFGEAALARGVSHTAPVAVAPVVAAPQPSAPAPLAPPLPTVAAGITPQSVIERFTKYLGDVTKVESQPGEKAAWVKSVVTHYGFENIMGLHDAPTAKLQDINDYLDSIGL